MTESDFLKADIVRVDAAVVGISKARWVGIHEGPATEERAAEIMLCHRFDVLPISQGESVREYFTTDRWNDFSSIRRASITHRDIIPLRTSIRDVIRGFATESRHFYFLSNAGRITGLISIADLNCREVAVYLFGMLSELEVALGELISAHLTDEELLDFVRSKTEQSQKCAEILARYEEDRKRGVDVPFVGYVYLSDLVAIAKKHRLYSLLGYTGPDFEKSLGPLVQLRNAVAHPNRSIVTTADSVAALWKNIDRLEEALFRLQRA